MLYATIINTPQDVVNFFFHLVFEKKVNLDPDTNFHDYVDSDGNKTFTDKQADQYEDDMNRSFEICEKNGLDTYKIAARILALHHYCDKNFAMADFYDKF